MLIAVASQNFRTITGHAGKTRRFLVFDAAPGRAPQEIQRLDLPKEQSIHEFSEQGPHPLDVVDVVIAGSAGPGFISRMASRDVCAITTAETDPVAAVQAYLAGSLAPAAPHDDEAEEEGGCNCSCGRAAG
ncbi:NifB/NifX family molybdenum-iron cluster-binding protein [Rhodopseudomonas pseudopalustris]|nr:nitrogen fixation protein [Rhodopseudomonas pseudopalustris]MBB1090218.1 nitrogen fixation protein [Rhodopseudomonas palustris]SEO05555.1 Dinitrogenase iron-molybdenum cofactor [Rhodopseudomonas pseudopalustris]